MINKNKIKKKSFKEFIKWLIIFIVLSFIVFYNIFYKNKTFITQYIIFYLLICITIILFCFTTKGKKVISFILQAKKEIKKIFWPTKQETFNTTLIIFIITIFMSLIFWILDIFLIFSISFFTSLRF